MSQGSAGQRGGSRAIVMPVTGRITAPGVRAGRNSMSENLLSEAQPVSFGERLANSPAFADLFRVGMALVEETATYLDGYEIGRAHV